MDLQDEMGYDIFRRPVILAHLEVQDNLGNKESAEEMVYPVLKAKLGLSVRRAVRAMQEHRVHPDDPVNEDYRVPMRGIAHAHQDNCE
ncbi:unnamed protein product [Gongylonema pulchrum]|uniref:DNA-directed RNA polymerase n=1 Tax=Gongylonema pulchrum TaxID=637853 RepID=A0A183EYI1_9BILA|nr:unnamed protein product [Gongylonema pulchrum]